MTAIILAAGVGKRLLGTSGGTPKCLIEIGGRSLLLRLLDGLAAAGVREAVVVTGFGDDLVRAALGGGGARHRRALRHQPALPRGCDPLAVDGAGRARPGAC